MADKIEAERLAKEYQELIASKRPQGARVNRDFFTSEFKSDPFHVPLISEVRHTGPAAIAGNPELVKITEKALP